MRSHSQTSSRRLPALACKQKCSHTHTHTHTRARARAHKHTCTCSDVSSSTHAIASTHIPHALPLQVIRLLENAFKATGLPAYLCSYGCLPTGYERGIIEVVPNTKSRCVARMPPPSWPHQHPSGVGLQGQGQRAPRACQLSEAQLIELALMAKGKQSLQGGMLCICTEHPRSQSASLTSLYGCALLTKGMNRGWTAAACVMPWRLRGSEPEPEACRCLHAFHVHLCAPVRAPLCACVCASARLCAHLFVLLWLRLCRAGSYPGSL